MNSIEILEQDRFDKIAEINKMAQQVFEEGYSALEPFLQAKQNELTQILIKIAASKEALG
jgi:hypothetical protein